MPKKKNENEDAEALKKEEEAKNAALELARKAVVKKYGDVVSVLEDHGDMHIPTISTGCLSLDLALGCGGMGLGRIYEIYGPNSGGKSTLAVNVVIQAQRRGMRCCYVDAEHAVDPKLFRAYGVDTKTLQLVQGYDGEENLDILERFIKTGAFSVAVVDSVSALIPRTEAESDIDKDQMALQARLMSKALRKITPTANQTQTLLIFINQLRMKIGGYGNPETTTGGEALAFYATGRIAVRGPESKKRRLVDETGEVIGHKAEFEVVKNKLAAPFKRAEVKLIYGKGYDAAWEVLDLATSLGIIDQRGAWFKYGEENIAQGETNAVQFLKDPTNAEIFKKVRDEVISQIGLGEAYERHGQQGPLYS
jgi:recombination protein RecA